MREESSHPMGILTRQVGEEYIITSDTVTDEALESVPHEE